MIARFPPLVSSEGSHCLSGKKTSLTKDITLPKLAAEQTIVFPAAELIGLKNKSPTSFVSELSKLLNFSIAEQTTYFLAVEQAIVFPVAELTAYSGTYFHQN